VTAFRGAAAAGGPGNGVYLVGNLEPADPLLSSVAYVDRIDPTTAMSDPRFSSAHVGGGSASYYFIAVGVQQDGRVVVVGDVAHALSGITGPLIARFWP
jgi:hypothetical protein